MNANIRVTAAVAAVLVLAASATMADDVQPKAERPSAGTRNSNSACLTQTGSRIAVKGANCSAIGRSYSNEDIRRTGASSVAGALRLMDPSITVHR